MYVNEYWKNFSPIDYKWHYLIAFSYTLIGTIGLIANLMVLFYLIK